MKINRKVSKALAAAFLALSAVSLAESSWGHPGRTDASGCHTNRKTEATIVTMVRVPGQVPGQVLGQVHPVAEVRKAFA
jgi:hypothetical protein